MRPANLITNNHSHTMAFGDISTIAFLKNQGATQISTDINQKFLKLKTPWITLYRQGFWEDEKSSKQSTFQFDRAKIVVSQSDHTEADEVDWANMDPDAADPTTNATITSIVPPADHLEYSTTHRDYCVQQKAVWGPPLYTEQLRNKFIRGQQLAAQVKALGDQGVQYMVDRKRDEYYRIADNKCVLDSGFTLAGGQYNNLAFPYPTGTDSSILTYGWTDMVYEFLNHQQAQEGALGYSNGNPVYGLVGSGRTGRRLITSDEQVREDIRWSNQNQKLCEGMGIKYSYGGFSMIGDDQVNRWEYAVSTATTYATEITAAGVITINNTTDVGRLYKGSQISFTNSGAGANNYCANTTAATLISNAYIIVQRLTATTYQVKRADGVSLATTAPAAVNSLNSTTGAFVCWRKIPPYVWEAATGGKRGEIATYRRVPNINWLLATWEDTVGFHQDVCETLVPKPITKVGEATFPAINYNGVHSFKVYENEESNPDGQIGKFRGIYANGTKPLNPEFGVIMRHLAVPKPDGRILDGSSLG